MCGRCPSPAQLTVDENRILDREYTLLTNSNETRTRSYSPPHVHTGWTRINSSNAEPLVTPSRRAKKPIAKTPRKAKGVPESLLHIGSIQRSFLYVSTPCSFQGMNALATSLTNMSGVIVTRSGSNSNLSRQTITVLFPSLRSCLTALRVKQEQISSRVLLLHAVRLRLIGTFPYHKWVVTNPVTFFQVNSATTTSILHIQLVPRSTRTFRLQASLLCKLLQHRTTVRLLDSIIHSQRKHLSLQVTISLIRTRTSWCTTLCVLNGHRMLISQRRSLRPYTARKTYSANSSCPYPM